ncbi:metallophosphoesterase family protein [Candidatus Fermentibacteria bacterium]|nr:metallophosphoesterase family protein [Candidatus Fermentibacteria bacterium]
MRIGILADVHGNLQGLEAAWRALAAEGADLVLNLGDLVQYGPHPEECVAFAMEHRIESVQGNCDRAAARHRRDTGDEFENIHWRRLAGRVLEWTSGRLSGRSGSWLRRLPGEMRFEVERVRILAVHGLPGRISVGLPDGSALGAEDMLAEEARAERDGLTRSFDLLDVYDHLLEESRADLLLLGHTHSQALIWRPSGLIVNPGSVGGGTLPSAGTAALADIGNRRDISVSWIRFAFDGAAYARDCRAAGIPELFSRCILLGRDQRGAWHTPDTLLRQRWALEEQES